MSTYARRPYATAAAAPRKQAYPYRADDISPGMSMDESTRVATGRGPGYEQRSNYARPAPSVPVTTTSPPKKRGAEITGAKGLWKTIQTIRDHATGTTKTTRVQGLPGGTVLNTCTRGPAGMCEALVFIPGVTPADFPTT